MVEMTDDSFGAKFWRFLDVWVGGVFRFFDRHCISRRLALYMTIFITGDSYWWAKMYIELNPNITALESAARIGAVLAPVTWLQGWVLKIYSETRTKEGDMLG